MSGRLHRTLAVDERGVTTIEFAIIAPVMVMLLLGFMELGHVAYVQATLQGAVQQAARDATLESGSAQSSAIDTAVGEQVRRVAGRDATFSSQRLAYTSFSQVGTAERFVDAPPLDGEYDVGECFEDVNGNSQWDSDLGRAGTGGAQDAVLYRVTVAYPRLFPMASLLGWSETNSVVATTVLRNQPWGDQQEPVFAECT